MSRKTRKLIWSVPVMAVLAIAGALAMFAVQAPGSAQATHEELPGAPQNFTIMADGHHEIKLSWDAPSSGGTPDGYRIDRSENNGTWFTHEPMHTGTSYTDTDLDAGSTYFYRVFAYNSAGTGPVSEDRTETTDAATNPGRVRSLAATPTGQNSIMLTWQAPEENGGAPIKHYEIHFAPNLDGSAVGTFPAATVLASTSDTDTVVATEGAVTTFSHGKLTAETRYRYVVYAVNGEDMKGTMPSAVRAAVTDDLVAPGQPTGLTAVQNGADTVQLYWYAPSNNGGTAITGYDSEARSNCTGSWTDVDTQWTNAAATGHDALWNVDSTTRETSVCFRVRARNSADGATGSDIRFGQYSSTFRLNLYPDEPARAAAIPPAVANGAATYSTDKAKVTWDAVDLSGLTATRVSGYRVDVSEDGISWMSIRGGSNTNRADDEGNPFFEYAYDGGEPRRYRIFAKVAQRLGPAALTDASTAATANVTAPGQVRNLMVMASGPTQIDLDWDAPTSSGNAPIDHYIVQAAKMGDTAFDAWPTDLDTDTAGNFKSETTSYAHMKLKAGETWQYRVFAINKDASGALLPVNTSVPDIGDAAEVDQATTPQEDMPRKPEHLSVEMASTSNSEAAGSTGLLLLWNAPQNPAGADIRGYQVQRMSNGGEWTTLSDDPDTGSLLTDFTDTEGLEDGETRAYRVRAVSENDVEGTWSDTAYYPAMRTHEPPAQAAPTNVDASADGTTVTITWEGGANADTFTVALLRRDAEGNWDIPNAVYDQNISGSPHTVNMATRPAGTYRVFVAAGTDDGVWSSWASGTLEYAP